MKLRRLREERARIAAFQARQPTLEDPDFEEWERTVQSLLREVFGAGELLLRFRQVACRPISYYVGGGRQWSSDPTDAWNRGLEHVNKILGEALEEADVGLPLEVENPAPTGRGSSVVVNVHNQNVFSPSVHVTVSQLLERIGTMELTPAEKELARQSVLELETETKGEGRWPIIARSLEATKSLGKTVYKDIAVPLIVEYLKREAGLGPGAA